MTPKDQDRLDAIVIEIEEVVKKLSKLYEGPDNECLKRCRERYPLNVRYQELEDEMDKILSS